MLAPGRPLETGRVCEVLDVIEGRPRKLAELVECLWDDEPGVCSRAADVLERVTRERPHQAQRWKDALLGLMTETTEKKVRWNLALLIPRLKLTMTDCRRAAETLQSCLDDPELDCEDCGAAWDGGSDPAGPGVVAGCIGPAAGGGAVGDAGDAGAQQDFAEGLLENHAGHGKRQTAQFDPMFD